MDVRMPDGSTETIRLLGVDAPETYSSTDPTEWEGIPDTVDGKDWLAQWGEQATAYAEERLAGRDIYIEVDEQADRRGYYGRLLVYAYQTQDSTTSFNRRLINNGYARLYDTSFSKRSDFADAEAAAQSGNVGAWGYSEPEPTATPTASGPDAIAITQLHEDAIGDEYDNLDDEYIVLENTGSDPIDMSGWTLSDEANHVYTFPADFSLDSGETVRVVTGTGSDTDSTLFWGQEAPVWNNNGDTVTVTTDSGEVVAERSYD